MFKIPWYTVLLLSIPQAFILIKLGMRLFNLDIKNKICFYIAVLEGCALYFLRQASITPGLHTIIGVLLMGLLVALLNKTNIGSALVAVLLGAIILGVIEGAWLPILLKITSSTLKDLEIHPWLNIIGYYPILAVAVIIYVIVESKKFVLFDLKRLGQINEKE